MPNVKIQEKPPQMPAGSDSDARAMAALGGGATDPNPEATAQRAAASVSAVEDDLTKGAPVKAGPAGQEKANGGDMTPGPILNKGKKKKDDEEDEDEETTKSLADVEVSEDALSKALDTALSIAREGADEPDPDRQVELTDKLSKGEITSDEAVELTTLIKSHIDEPETDAAGDEDPLDKSFTEAALSDPDVTAGHKDDNGFEISGWLARQSAFVGGALDRINGELKDSLTKGFASSARFNLAMAKANRVLGHTVLEQQELIKSLGGRLEVVEETPEPRRAAPSAAALAKSLPQTEIGGSMPSRSDVIRGLTALNKSSDDGKAPCGADIGEGVARFESCGLIPESLLSDVKKVINQ